MIDLCPDDIPELKSWRAEVREFLEEELPGTWTFWYDFDENPESWERYLSFWRRVGEKKWTGLTWPTKYHGLGRSAIEKWILEEEFVRHDAPTYPAIGLYVGGHLLRHGNHEQRKKHLKGIVEGTVLWGEGYSEPGAGSDLARLTTKAHKEGDQWVISGQKTLGTAAHLCHWMAVLARTNPDVPTHSGISCFMVPLDAPGVEILPLDNIAGGRQNMTYFDEVRVPEENLLGTENEAWRQIWFRMGGDQLDNAGPSLGPVSMRIVPFLERFIRYCKETMRDDRQLSKDPIIRQQLGDLIMGVEAIKLMAFESYSNAYTTKPIRFGDAASAMNTTVFKEFWPHLARTCMEIAGPLAQIKGGKWAQLEGQIEHYFRASFGNHAGGTSQVKRMVLATRGLGLPR